MDGLVHRVLGRGGFHSAAVEQAAEGREACRGGVLFFTTRGGGNQLSQGVAPVAHVRLFSLWRTLSVRQTSMLGVA